MTMFTWLGRQRLHALGEDYAVNKTHNYVEGHSGSYEHIETCLDHILPQILAEDAHLYIVGITSSAEYFIRWYQSRQCTLGTPHSNRPDVPDTLSMITAVAFIEPTHNASNIKCEAMEHKLKECGRQWVKSDKPLGTFLTAVKPLATPTLPSLPTVAKGSDLHLPDYSAAFTEAATTTLTPHAGIKKFARVDLADLAGKADLKDPIAGDAPVVVSYTGTTLANPAENVHDVTLESGSSSEPAKRASGLDSMISNGTSAVEAEGAGPHSGTTQVPAVENALKGLDITSQEPEIGKSAWASRGDAIFELPTDGEDADDSMTFTYDHTKEIVSCASYSGETDVDELIWPNIMEQVLSFFKEFLTK